MMHNDMMVGAFSHSTAVGKLRKDLPDVPADARINFARYNLDEAATVCHYYLRQRLVRREVFSEEGWKKIFYLSNGNGSEMRWLLPFMRWWSKVQCTYIKTAEFDFLLSWLSLLRLRWNINVISLLSWTWRLEEVDAVSYPRIRWLFVSFFGGGKFFFLCPFQFVDC